MYQEFFGLSEKPFNITPNPRFMFLSKNHREVFAHLLYGIRHHAGFIEVTGEVGTGKTTVLRTLFSQLDNEAYRLAFIFNPSLSSLELLRSVNREFNLAEAGARAGELLAALNDFLLKENAAGRTVVLVIDEAQNLEVPVLEQIRMLSNLETETDKLIQIVLVGQPELGTLLSRPEMRQLSQRITVRYHLRAMDFDDTRAYIEHRLGVAGHAGGHLFTPEALRRVFKLSHGLPRLINVLCDRALVVAYSEDRKEIGPAIVATAAKEMRRELPAAYGGAGRFWLAALPLMLVVVLLGSWLLQPPSVPESLATVAVVAEPAIPLSPPTHSSSGWQEMSHSLSDLSTEQSAAMGFDSLARLWHVAPLDTRTGLSVPDGLFAAARERELGLVRFRGGLDPLLQMDAPVLLQIVLPETGENRYLALTGSAGSQVLIAPPIGGQDRIDLEQLRRLWSGVAYLPWKNPLDLPSIAQAGTSGDEVLRLQQLLGETGDYAEVASGIYDRATIRAVTAFQLRRGLAADGQVGPQTLLALYQAVKGYEFPRLGLVEGTR